MRRLTRYSLQGTAGRPLSFLRKSWRGFAVVTTKIGGNSRLIGLLCFFAVCGSIILVHSHAATPAISLEPENGALAGNAQQLTDASASGGAATQFGKVDTPSAPVGLRAVTGGPAVALLWNPQPGTAAINYAVFRDGAQLATVAPAPENPVPAYRAGTRYIDTAAAPGVSYNYQVQAIDESSGQKSALSSPLTVRIPPSTTPAPVISVDTAAAPDLADWLTATVVPEIKLWYPKESDYLAFPAYVPPSSFKLVLVSSQSNPAEAHWDTGEIRLSADWYRAHPGDISSIIHECAHIIQDDSGLQYPSWVIEGTASWISHKLYEDDSQFGPMQQPTQLFDSYSDGYDHAGTLLEYIQDQNHPGLIRDLNIAIHNQTYTTAGYFVNNTGKTADQWWKAMTGRQITSGTVKSVAYPGICLDDWASGTGNGNKLDNYPCNGTDAQMVYRLPQSDGTSYLKVFGSCLDDTGSGAADGNPVQLWSCNGSGAQKWRINTNKTITNVVSGKCLYNGGGNTVLATQLTIKTCNAADPGQQWSAP